MVAMEKIREAEFFLGKMRESYSSQKEFVFYLSACLAACNSIPDYLLEEYNIKYGLSIPLTERLYADTFEQGAKQIGHNDAVSFIQFWKDKMNALRADAIGSLLVSKRHLDIHRVQVRPDLVKVEIHEASIHISDSIRVEKFNKEGKLVEVYESPKEELRKKEEGSARVDWFFKEYETEPIMAVCEKFLMTLKDFVEEARKKFP